MIKRIFMSVLLLGALSRCEKAGDFTPASEPSVFTTSVLDTFQVVTSTLLIDSILTSDVDRLLAGHVADEDMGSVKASAYIKFGPNANLDFEGRSVKYDSLYLSLRFDGYALGEATEPQRFSIREILEEYGANGKTDYYNCDQLVYGRTSLGTFDFDPDWESGDSIAIRLSDELGQKLFNLAQNGEVRAFSEDFERAFEGLALVPESMSEGQIVGFQNSSNPTGLNQENAIYLRMYYHEVEEFTNNFRFDFVQSDPKLAFNGQEVSREGTDLASLSDDNPIYAEEAGEMTFIQAVTGLQTKIRFPSLDRLNELDNGYFVNRAILRLEPLKGSFATTGELPDSLALYLTDRYNEIGNVTFDAVASTSLAQYARLQIDEERGLFACYEFDVTQFVLQQLQDQNQNELALLAAPTAPAILGGLDQVRLGGQKHLHQGVNLEIYLTKWIE